MDRERLRGFIESFGPLSFLGFILLQAAQVIAAPVPGEVTGLIGGYLYGSLGGTFISTVGLTLGSYIAFTISKTFGRPFVEKFVRPETIGRFDYLLRHKGSFLVFFLFLLPGFPKDTLCYILGLGHMPLTEFLIIGGVGRLLGTALLSFGGSYLRLHQYERFFILAGSAVVLIIIVLAYRDKIEKILRRKSRKKE
jgi:uncharacterized membrane protein YdjX (TVP38/TMEM64 family)